MRWPAACPGFAVREGPVREMDGGEMPHRTELPAGVQHLIAGMRGKKKHVEPGKGR